MDDQEKPTALRASQGPIPVRPATLPELADLILTRLALDALSSEIVIGGGIALKHYADFRPTQDLDAWWRERRLDGVASCIQAAIEEVSEAKQLTTKHRQWGGTDSFDLHESTGKRVFSFQIAERDVTLDSPLSSEWPPIKLESLRDTIGSKMNALVNRGAPRDFLDIFEVVQRNLGTAEDCWHLWEMKNPDTDRGQAMVDVLAYLERIIQRRPMGALPEPEREQASHVRAWFATDFCQPRKQGNHKSEIDG